MTEVTPEVLVTIAKAREIPLVVVSGSLRINMYNAPKSEYTFLTEFRPHRNWNQYGKLLKWLHEQDLTVITQRGRQGRYKCHLKITDHMATYSYDGYAQTLMEAVVLATYNYIRGSFGRSVENANTKDETVQ